MAQQLTESTLAPRPAANALRHEVVIVGGGNAGISIAARLRRARPKTDIAIIERADKHY
jgi:sulfide:quinone oxidoreductase